MKKVTLSVMFILACIYITTGQNYVTAKSMKEAGITSGAVYNTNPKTTVINEGFETFPANMNGWTIISNNAYTWEVATAAPYAGLQNIACQYDSDLTGVQDEWLITPEFDFSAASDVNISFYWNGSYYWSVDPYDNCDLLLCLSIDGGTSWDTIWDETMETAPWTNWTWYDTLLNVPAAIGESSVTFAYVYTGYDGAEFSVDEVTIDTTGALNVGIPVSLTPAKTKLYPNPAVNSVTVESSASIQEINIFNTMGLPVLQVIKPDYRAKLDISSLPEGFYNMIIITDSGKTTKKLTIKR